MKFKILCAALVVSLAGCSKNVEIPSNLVPVAEKLCDVADAQSVQMGGRIWFPTFKEEFYTKCSKDGFDELLEISLSIKKDK